jgi:hypothetical protein
MPGFGTSAGAVSRWVIGPTVPGSVTPHRMEVLRGVPSHCPFEPVEQHIQYRFVPATHILPVQLVHPIRFGLNTYCCRGQLRKARSGIALVVLAALRRGRTLVSPYRRTGGGRRSAFPITRRKAPDRRHPVRRVWPASRSVPRVFALRLPTSFDLASTSRATTQSERCPTEYLAAIRKP